MVLVPRPPLWLESEKLSSQQKEEGTVEKKEEVGPDMKVLSPGADVVPAPEPKDTSKRHYKVVTIGKKQLPTLELMAKTKQRGGRHPVFWGTVTAVGDDLEELERGMEEKTYETKTRGTRHMEPARLVARGVYAIVNRESPRVPSEQRSHFAYRISHPPPENIGEVQHAFGILDAAAFVIQIKNPLAPPITPQQRSSNRAQYPKEFMRAVFGAGTGRKGRNNYGLRFASCETPELLDYKGAEILFIAAREGQSGVEETIGEERGRALKEADEQEEKETIDDIYKELCRLFWCMAFAYFVVVVHCIQDSGKKEAGHVFHLSCTAAIVARPSHNVKAIAKRIKANRSLAL